MTTTNELHELAKDPQAFDTVLATEHANLAKIQAALKAAIDKLHRAVGDRTRYVGTTRTWGFTQARAYELARDAGLTAELTAIAEARFALAECQLAIEAMNEAYTGWTRFFPSVTKSQPHIHRSLTCHTLYPTTVMSWAPSLSGKSDQEAVDELDEALCSVCFPSAPVKLREYVSKRSILEQAARDAEARARADAKAAKTLTEAEQFRTTGKYGERVETVAKCKELVRAAIKAEVELEWTKSNNPGWDAEQFARVIENRTDTLAEARADAAQAALVLVHREQEHEGWGATAEAIAKIKASALKSARKEWGL